MASFAAHSSSLSEAFARSSGSLVEAVGAFSLKGFGAAQPVFALRDR